MNCREFRKRIADLFDLHPGPQLQGELGKHLAACPVCAEEYKVLLKLIKELEPRHRVEVSPDFEERVLNSMDSYAESPGIRLNFPGLSRISWWKPAAVLAIAAVLLVIVLTVDWRSLYRESGGSGTGKDASFALLSKALAAQEEFLAGEGIKHIIKELVINLVPDSIHAWNRYLGLSLTRANGKSIHIDLRYPPKPKRKYTIRDEAWYDKSTGRLARLMWLEGKVLFAYSYNGEYVCMTEQLPDSSIKIVRDKAAETFTLPEKPLHFFGFVAGHDSVFKKLDQERVIDLGPGRLEDGTPVRIIKTFGKSRTTEKPDSAGQVISYHLFRIRQDNNLIAEMEWVFQGISMEVTRYVLDEQVPDTGVPWSLEGIDSLLAGTVDFLFLGFELQSDVFLEDLSAGDILANVDMQVFLFSSNPLSTNERKINFSRGGTPVVNISYLAEDKRNVVLFQPGQRFRYWLVATGELTYASLSGFKFWKERDTRSWANMLLRPSLRPSREPPAKDCTVYIVQSPVGTDFPLAINGPLSIEELEELAGSLMLAEEYLGRDLLERGADLKAEKYGWTALFAAVGRGENQKVKELLAAGADPNTANSRTGYSVLMLAAGKGLVPAEETLLQAGADPNAKTKAGLTALMLAAGSGQPETVKALVSLGADIAAMDRHGHTALKQAAMGGHVEAAKMLLEAGADVNKKTDKGWTVLMGAVRVREEPLEIVELLLQAGANLNARDADGKTALDWALEEGNDEAVKLLKQAGAVKR